ncbi:Integrator complex subunit 3 [Smittium culicis]|uniref:Integrator complex subunit 3 n=1 Tax=Smittium culicis TaxID=133412 RepID=A0A1R1X6A1_9FUNG|nr:Integrator complex subunit 3 [Smittium culicis]
MRGGDISRANIRLCQYILDFTTMNKKWVYMSPDLVATLFYAYSRLTLDHGKFPDLRDQECDFVVSLFSERVSSNLYNPV